jgi:hypothetical protein
MLARIAQARQDLFTIRRAEQALWLFSAALCLELIFIYGFIVIRTISYPYLLEWLEGSSVEVAARAAGGLPVYTQPEYDYVTVIYTPLYHYATAFLYRFLGVGLFGARLLSVVSSVAVSLLIWQFVRRERGSRFAALVGVGLFFGCYEVTNHYYNVARVDSFFLLVLLTAFFVLRFWPGLWGAAMSGLIFSLAFFAKQTALFALVPALLILGVVDFRRTLAAGSVFAVTTAAVILIADATTEGWFSFFVFEVPGGHPIAWGGLLGFWPRDLFRPLLIAFFASAFLPALVWRRDRSIATFYAAFLAGMIVCAWMGRLHSGGARNTLMPLTTALAIMLPLTIPELVRKLTDFNVPMPRVIGRGLIAVQLLTLLYEPWSYIPTADNLRAGEAQMAFLRNIDGEVLIMSQRFVQRQAGKTSGGLDYVVTDVELSGNREVYEHLQHSILDALTQRKFVGVIDPPEFILRSIKLGPPVLIQPPPLPVNPTTNRFRQRPMFYYPLE